MADLFAFLYYLSVLDPAGNPARGRLLFGEKRCDTCHSATLSETGKAGPAVPYWSAHTTMAGLAQAMWNHARKMQSQKTMSGLAWVKLGKSDLADIVAYVRVANQIAETKAFVLGNQVRGRELFVDRGCADCHGTCKAEAKNGPSVAEMSGAARRVGEMGAILWNHYPVMNALSGVAAPSKFQLSVDEMADVFAYLFSTGYFSDGGNPTSGSALFASRKCVTCHEERDSRRSPLYALSTNISFIEVATALWNHGPTVMQGSTKAGLQWPQLTESQVADLMAYLKTRQGSSVAAIKPAHARSRQ